MKKGTVTFKDGEANFSTMRFKGQSGSLMTDVDTLSAVLAGYSACDLRVKTLLEKSYVSATGTGNRDRKGIITLQDSEGETHKWALPGYDGATETDHDGEKIEATVLAALAAAISAFDGEVYTTLRSPVIQTR